MRRGENQALISEIKKRYTNVNRPFIEPVWEMNFSKLLIFKDQDYQKDKDKFQLIENVPIQYLVVKLDESYVSIFELQTLFNSSLCDSRVCEILDRRENKLPIDPPTLFWSYPTSRILIDNGLHRINTAIQMNATHLPVLIPSNNLLIKMISSMGFE